MEGINDFLRNRLSCTRISVVHVHIEFELVSLLRNGNM
jgi:hypothetical protein